jgi:photosystem II stability/assembly factor-like uncharacterized protein
MSALLSVGTAGMSVWFSRDLGETWVRPYVESGLYPEARVWALASDPSAPGRLIAGTDSGLYRFDAASERWTHLPSPLDGLCVWALAVSPHDPKLMLAGTQPAALFRSADGGATWRKLEVRMAENCPFVELPRVTQVLFDPHEPGTVWAGVEIDGVWKSVDSGLTWAKSSAGLVSDDVHGLAVAANNARTVFATTNKGLHASDDRGGAWRHVRLDSPWQYTRAVVPAAGRPETLFLTNGDGPPGSTGRLLVSRDHGAQWRDAELPGELNSTPWCLASNAADADLLFVATNLGQLFRSQDGGRSWTKLKREFGEVRSINWQPLN